MVICFDLDGTLCETDENLPIPDRYVQAEIKLKMKEFITRLYNNGHTIIIDTARCSGTKGILNIFKRLKIKKLTKRQLQTWDIPYHELRIGIKHPADIYIDDKCLPVSAIENCK